MLRCWALRRWALRRWPAEAPRARAQEAPNAHEHELELVTDERTFRFRAPDDATRSAWISALSSSSDLVADTGDTWEESWTRDDIGMRRQTKRDMAGENRVLDMGEELRTSGGTFEDPDFPPDDSSLFGAGGRSSRQAAQRGLGQEEWRRDKKAFLAGKKVVWQPPSKIMDVDMTPVMFSGGIEADDIKQGELGNCYFLAAMGAIASHQKLVEDLIVEESLDVGILGVKFFVNGRWTTVIIDHMLPCVEINGLWQPIFCKPHIEAGSDEKELWCCYMEKAFAKLFGSCKSSSAPFPRFPSPIIPTGRHSSVWGS